MSGSVSEPLHTPLRSLFWETTLRCNAYCAFCGSRCGDVTSDEVSGEEIRRTFHRIAEAYDPHDIMVSVTGGEPLVREDVFDVMEDASALGFPWGMTTNGSLITDDIVHKMMRSRMRTISVSIDGLPATHNALRKIPDGWKRSMEGIARLRDAHFLNHIQVTTVVNHQNVSELDDLYELLLPMNLDSWRVGIVDPIGRAKGQESLLCDRFDMEAYFAFMDRHQFDEILLVTSSCSHYLGRRDEAFHGHPFFCMAGKTVASILANGDIFVCPNVERNPDWIQGNIRTDDFVEVWENGYQWFRYEENRKVGICEKCPAWMKCMGDCLHSWDYAEAKPRYCMKQVMAGTEDDWEEPHVVEILPEAEQSLDRIRRQYSEIKHQETESEPAFLLWGIPRRNSVQVRQVTESSWDRINSDDPMLQNDGGDHLVGILRLHIDGILGEMDTDEIILHKKLREQTTGYRLFGVMVPRFSKLSVYWDSPRAVADMRRVSDQN